MRVGDDQLAANLVDLAVDLHVAGNSLVVYIEAKIFGNIGCFFD